MENPISSIFGSGPSSAIQVAELGLSINWRM
jgi:hypothetical protein